MPSKHRLYIDGVGNSDLQAARTNPNHRYLSLTGVIVSLDPYAHGYTALFGVPPKDVSVVNVSALGSAGAIVSTVDDVARFYRALFRGRLFPKSLLRPMTTEVVHAPNAGGRAIGLGVWRHPLSCSLVWGHDGDWLGYWTRVWGSANGTRQVVISVNADTDSLGEAGSAALQRLENLAYCG